MTVEFTQLDLHPQLVQAVVERGYSLPTPIQAGVIPVMLAGRDVLGQAQTGTGKTAAFALPMLHNLEPHEKYVQKLVVAPTRELALQVADAVTTYGRHLDVKVLAVYGGQAYGPQISSLKRGVDIVVGTPGRLLDLIRKGALDLSRVRTVVLDEADEMLSMGFIEDIESLLAATPGTRQTALFSATLPAEIRRLAEGYMRDPQVISIQPEQVTVQAITQRYYLVNGKEKLEALTRLIEMEEITSALIFVRTRADSSDMANELTARGFPAEALNGDLSQEARERTLNHFRQGRVSVLVATDVAARGLDIENISHVINVDLPADPEIYVHRIGRTGRAGRSGIAISLVSPFERRYLRQVEAFARCKIERAAVPTEEEILASREASLVKQLTVWLQRGRCRRERELAGQLLEQGFDPLDVAAAALKMARAEEKQRPVAQLSEVVESRPSRTVRDGRGSRDGGRRSRTETRPLDLPVISHEEGMVRLSLNLGRQDGIRPSDIVGAIAFHADIPGRVIGKILIDQKNSLVDVPEEFAPRVLARSGAVRFRRQPVDVQLA